MLHVRTQSYYYFEIKGRVPHIVGCPEEERERTHCFAVHAFEVLTPNSIFHQFIICMFYLSKFHTKQDFCLHFIYTGNGIFKLWEFYHPCPSAGNKQSAHIVSFPAGAHVHVTICKTLWGFLRKKHLLMTGHDEKVSN